METERSRWHTTCIVTVAKEVDTETVMHRSADDSDRTFPHRDSSESLMQRVLNEEFAAFDQLSTRYGPCPFNAGVSHLSAEKDLTRAKGPLSLQTGLSSRAGGAALNFPVGCGISSRDRVGR